jgi:hypothetical protein
MSHEPADEVHIAAEPIQLGYCYATPKPVGFRESSLELRSAVEGIGPLPCLDLNEFAEHLKAFRLRK